MLDVIIGWFIVDKKKLFEDTRYITINGLLSGDLKLVTVHEMIRKAIADELYEQCEAMNQAIKLYDEICFIRQVRAILHSNNIISNL